MDNATAQDASAEAVHKAKNAAQAVEFARQAQMQEAVSLTKDALLEGLKEIFGDSTTPGEEMTLIHSKIPVLCVQVKTMQNDIASVKGDVGLVQKDVAALNDNLKWGVRLILGAVVAGVIALLFK